MEKYELDAALESNLSALLKETLPEPEESVIVTFTQPKSRKQVKFNENVEIQWPEAAERLRREAAEFIARRKAEREARLVALVYRDEGLDKGKSEEDPEHPHFPFPQDFKPIDFEHLDPYKLYRATEYLRQEERRLSQPFLQHSKKLKWVSAKAEEECRKEEKRLMRMPAPPRQKPNPKQAEILYTRPITPGSIRQRLSEASPSSTTTFSLGNVVGDRAKTVPALPQTYKSPPSLLPQLPKPPKANFAMRNVAKWLKTNFKFKPVPLILHPPKLLSSADFPVPLPSIDSISMPESMHSDFYLQPPGNPNNPNEPRELHILNGLVTHQNVFNSTVGNCFAEGYDSTKFKENLDYKQNWVPHRFRCIINMERFQDHEISFYFKRPFLTVKGDMPRTLRRLGERAEETVEVPDWLRLQNLIIFRLANGKIVIEESGPRKPPPPRPPIDEELLRLATRHFPPDY